MQDKSDKNSFCSIYMIDPILTPKLKLLRMYEWLLIDGHYRYLLALLMQCWSYPLSGALTWIFLKHSFWKTHSYIFQTGFIIDISTQMPHNIVACNRWQRIIYVIAPSWFPESFFYECTYRSTINEMIPSKCSPAISNNDLYEVVSSQSFMGVSMN